VVDVSLPHTRHHAREYPVSHRLRDRLVTHRIAITVIFCVILVLGLGLAFQSQSTETAITSLLLTPEQLT